MTAAQAPHGSGAPGAAGTRRDHWTAHDYAVAVALFLALAMPVLFILTPLLMRRTL